MKSTNLNSRWSPRGFSLFEIIVVLGIAVIVFGSAAVLVSSPKEESLIREAHNQIEDLAQQAWVMSSNYQQTFMIELKEGQVSMMPEAAPTDQVREEEFEGNGQPSALKPLESFSWPRVGQIDPNYEIWVLRWGQSEFRQVIGDKVEKIYFPPGGPYEPLTIKMISLDGNVLLSRKYHPLTASATDDELIIQSAKKK